MTEPSTTEPQTVTLPRDVLENLVSAAYSRGWNNSRYWPHRPLPVLGFKWPGPNQTPVFYPIPPKPQS